MLTDHHERDKVKDSSIARGTRHGLIKIPLAGEAFEAKRLECYICLAHRKNISCNREKLQEIIGLYHRVTILLSLAPFKSNCKMHT